MAAGVDFFGECEAAPRADPYPKRHCQKHLDFIESLSIFESIGAPIAQDFFALARKVCAQDRSVRTVRDGSSTDLKKLSRKKTSKRSTN
jgi:hypothetical protein